MEASEDSPQFERTLAETASLIEAGAQLIDVRQDYEYEAARIPGAFRIGLDILADDRAAVKKDEPVVFYCRTGTRSAMAAQAFLAAGYDVNSLTGGITAWVEDGREIDPVDGYIAEPGEAAAILEARKRSSGG